MLIEDGSLLSLSPLLKSIYNGAKKPNMLNHAQPLFELLASARRRRQRGKYTAIGSSAIYYGTRITPW